MNSFKLLWPARQVIQTPSREHARAEYEKKEQIPPGGKQVERQRMNSISMTTEKIV